MKNANRHSRWEVATATRPLVVLTVLCAWGGMSEARAGDLNPPPGPVAPTMKPLTDVEPRTAINAVNTPGDADSLYKITQPGSYHLTGNITGEAGMMGIEIAASGVTLDLMGFELTGVVGSLQGIRASVFNTRSIAVRNGAVRDWGDVGIDLSLSEHNQLADLRVISNGLFGIQGGNATSVIHCTSSLNASGGMQLQNAAVVTGCSMQGNAGDGMSANLTAAVAHCAARSNGGTGINVSSGSNVTACTATENTGRGITVGNGSTISDCTALSNHNDGFLAAAGCTLTHCTSYSNIAGGDGIEIGNSTTVTNCTVSDNTGNGIVISSAANIASVIGCTATLNDGHGITVGGGMVTGCESSGNGGDGIRIIGSCRITDNKALGNGLGAGIGAGVHVTQANCSIERNFVAANDIGIDVDSAPNLIIGNSARLNTTDYDIIAGNMTGTILSGAAAMNAATNTYANLRIP